MPSGSSAERDGLLECSSMPKLINGDAEAERGRKEESASI